MFDFWVIGSLSRCNGEGLLGAGLEVKHAWAQLCKPSTSHYVDTVLGDSKYS